MGEHTLQPNRGKLHRMVKEHTEVPVVDPDTSHPGVNFQVISHFHAERLRRQRKPAEGLYAVDGGQQIVVESRCLFTRQRPSEHDDRAPDALFPEGDRLVHDGHGEGVDTHAFQGSSHRCCAVAVGVGLDHGNHLDALFDSALQVVIVVRQRPYVDLGPGLLKSRRCSVKGHSHSSLFKTRLPALGRVSSGTWASPWPQSSQGFALRPLWEASRGRS